MTTAHVAPCGCTLHLPSGVWIWLCPSHLDRVVTGLPPLRPVRIGGTGCPSPKLHPAAKVVDLSALIRTQSKLDDQPPAPLTSTPPLSRRRPSPWSCLPTTAGVSSTSTSPSIPPPPRPPNSSSTPSRTTPRRPISSAIATASTGRRFGDALRA